MTTSEQTEQVDQAIEAIKSKPASIESAEVLAQEIPGLIKQRDDIRQAKAEFEALSEHIGELLDALNDIPEGQVDPTDATEIVLKTLQLQILKGKYEKMHKAYRDACIEYFSKFRP